MVLQAVGDKYSFPGEELSVLKLWEELDAFKTQLKLSEGRPEFSFYDGPPFATGLPHYGHLLAGTIKDIVTRFACTQGFHVERRFGWDTHGLPVEFEIDKKLGITGKDDVMAMGIDKYNAECRAIVMRYASEWISTVQRIGRWIDFENDYKTLYPSFMESCWWVCKQMFDKGLFYRGFKVLAVSTACATPLSNFEVQQNYKEVVDPAVVVAFPDTEEPEVNYLIWTTTPWTLPSNLALCVHDDMDYVKIKDVASDAIYVLMKQRLVQLYKNPTGKDKKKFVILEEMKGSALKGKTYEPMFPYFKHMKAQGAFRIVSDNYVTADSGTGIVHNAPGFGEDDYRVCMAAGIILKGGELPCPVDMSGRYTEEVSDYVGRHVKECDKDISKAIKAMGRMVHQGTDVHNYPFCWRSDTPLIYKAIPSWFVKVEAVQQKLLDNNKDIHWVPEYVGKSRFQNWLESSPDWSVSRTRYWGTPLPIWVSEDYEEMVCIGSIAELEELCGEKVSDLHRDSIDHLTIPSKTGRGVLRRVEEVFDCWFESGSMPYAQSHYPFENNEMFEKTFPADFIAEGLDQTRGWFYTLLVIGTILFDKAPMKNVVVNGLVLAEDGKKMSKRLKNYPDPNLVLEKYGADALRLYLINSPVVRADVLRFKESGVADVIKDVFLPWFNSYRFLVQNVHKLEAETDKEYKFDFAAKNTSENVMDKWLLASMHKLIQEVNEEMAGYRLYAVVPKLLSFIEDLTNWYVRLNRRRIRGEEGTEDASHAVGCLFETVYTLCKLMAPFTPFLAEKLYQNLKGALATKEQEHDASIHFLLETKPKPEYFNDDITRRVARMQAVIGLGRVIRDRNTLPVKYPLKELVVLHSDEQYLEDVQSMAFYIKSELNINQLITSNDEAKYGISLRATVDFKKLGKRLGKDMKKVSTAVAKMDSPACREYAAKGSLTVEGHTLEGDDITLIQVFGNEQGDHTYAHNSDNDVLCLLDTHLTEELKSEGLAREIISRVQKARKTANVEPLDPLNIVYTFSDDAANDELKKVCESHKDFIENLIRNPFVAKAAAPPTNVALFEEDCTINEGTVTLAVHRRES